MVIHLRTRDSPSSMVDTLHNFGTAHPQFVETGAQALVHSLPSVKVYAKTGTLSEQNRLPSTSRLALVLVHWDRSGKIKKGLGFSIVVERGKLGLASQWLGEYLVFESQGNAVLRSEPQVADGS